jgi:hypothetical protein
MANMNPMVSNKMAKKKKSKPEKDHIDQLMEHMDKKKTTPEFKKYMEKMEKSVNDYDHRHDEARKYGKRVAQNLIKKYHSIPYKHDGKIRDKDGLQTDVASAAIAEILFHCYMKEQGSDCGELLNKWIHEKLWGKIVVQYIPKLLEVWQYLHDNKYTKNNTLGYGDIDGSIWVEYPKQLKKWPDKRKIIVHTSHCTTADDNTHIFVINESEISSITQRLHVRTVWPRERSKGIFKWELIPSIHTYRKNNFRYRFGDGRDKGYTLTLKGGGTPSIDGASYYQGKIQHAIGIIERMKVITTDESYQCK